MLDLYAGGGGTAEGWRQAGFTVTGVDMVRRAAFPPGVEFIKADVLDVLTDTTFLASFDAIHASPPCKVHTRLGHMMEAQGGTPIHGDLVDVTRDALHATGKPYVLENVEGAPLRPDVILCGSHFPELSVTGPDGHRWLKRHRLFELGRWGQHGFGIQPECDHPATKPLGVWGTMGDALPNGGECARTLEEARKLMGMPWGSWASLTQAIPPPYTRYLGQHLMAHLSAVAV